MKRTLDHILRLGACVLLVSGVIIKTYKLSTQLRFQPAIEGGRIYVGTQDGKVVCIDTGDKNFTGWPCWGGNPAHTGLALAGGK
jgi:outer membrane protein assembly factor BamB